jgi:hypothetical protein
MFSEKCSHNSILQNKKGTKITKGEFVMLESSAVHT